MDENYLVKSGYQLVCEKENREKASVSNASNIRNFWNRVWKLRIPNKIKNFFWRACLEALPTLVNLQGKKNLEVS